MDPLFLTLIQLCALTSSTGACLFRDASHCPAKSPLVFGGRIQAQNPDDIIWENGRKVFVLQTPLANTRSHLGSSRRFQLRGSRGVIRIASKSCARSGEGSNVACPVTLPSNLPCRLQGIGSCSSDPLSVSKITSSSNKQAVTTLCEGLDPVQNITVSNAGGKLHVSWSPPDGLCPVHVYNVTYLLLRYKACDDDELLSQIYPPLQTNRTELTLDLYDDFAEYNISVTPFTESIAGTGVLMEGETVSMTGTTQPNVPLSYNQGVNGFYQTVVTATTLEVSRNKLIGLGSSKVNAYLLMYGKKESTKMVTHFMGQNLTFQDEELSPDTDYQFQLAVICNEKGNVVRGFQSEQQTFTTLCGVPAKPVLNLTSETVTSRSAAFYYTFPEDEDPWKCRNVSVYFQMETDAGEWETVQEMSTDDRIVDKSDLKPCSDYRFRLKVVNKHEVTFSNEVKVATDVEQLGDVQNLLVKPLNEDGKLLVTWDPPKNIANCTIDGYGVSVDFVGILSCKMKNKKNNAGSHRVNTTMKILDGLQSYSKYYVSVVPLFNYGGNPAESKYAIGTTKAVSPTGIVEEVELKENATSDRSLTFAWKKGLNCEEKLGPKFRYICVLYEMNGGNPVLVRTRTVSEQQCTFSDLKACGSYICKVKPVNDDNEGNFSSPVYGNISAAALGSVRNISFIFLDNGDVFVSWVSPNDSSNLCPVHKFKLNYTLQRHQACHKCIDRKEPPLKSNETFLVMKNLSPFTTYKINVAVDVEGGASDLEPTDIVLTTRFAAPSLAPRVWAVIKKVNKTELTFKWTLPSCTSLNGIFKQYTIGGNATKGETGISMKRIRPNHTLYDLTPCTVYSFTARFVNTFRQGPMGVAHQKTADDRPGGGFNLMLEPQDNGDLLAIWQESRENPCKVDSYIINIQPLEDKCKERRHVINESDIVLDRNDRNFTFRRSDLSLWGSTEYQVSLRAVNTLGESDSESAWNITNVLRPSGSPMGVVLSDTTSTSAKFTWDAVNCPDTNGEITGYRYRLTLNGEAVEKETTIWQVVFNDLTPRTNYTFNVQGGTSAGFGPWSDDIFFETTE